MADRPGAFHHAEAPVWAAARVAGASVAEAAAMGFKRAIVPASVVEAAPKGIEVVGVRTLEEAIAAAIP